MNAAVTALFPDIAVPAERGPYGTTMRMSHDGQTSTISPRTLAAAAPDVSQDLILGAV